MSATEQDLLLELVERVQHRFFGKYRGCVTKVDTASLRIKANVPAVLGENETGWCVPCLPYAGPNAGFAFLPEVGAGVWIEFEGGDVSYPIWVGCYWREQEPPPEVTPTVKAIIAGGSKLLFDDDNQAITLSDPSGNTVTLDSSGITLQCRGKKIAITSTAVSINDGALEVL